MLLVGLIVATFGIVGVRELAGGPATEPAAAAPPSSTPPLVTHRRSGSLDRSARPANPPTKPKQAALSVEGDRLPVDSPDALPPIVVVRARSAPKALRASLERRVLRYGRLAASPKARRAIKAHRVSAGALRLLLNLPKTGTPAILWSARGNVVSVQERRMWMTEQLIGSYSKLPSPLRPASYRLKPFLGLTGVHAPHGGDLGAQVVAIAMKWIGLPYSWGGGNASGPTRGVGRGAGTVGFDCSGLTLYAYAQVGIRLDHYAAFQFHEGRRIAPGQLKPGDLLFWHPKADGPGHVGIYIGGGKMLHAPHTGDVVHVTDIRGKAGYLGAVRPYE